MSEKVLVAMSGGVDSSVCAYLLQQQGYDCIGVTMKLLESDGDADPSERACCSLDAVEDARAVAYRLGIPYYVFNFVREFREKVMEPFVCAYERGETPNPCIECNRFLKFEALFQRAKELGCDYVATGHYVRIDRESLTLREGLDARKDQSYMLCRLTREQLSHCLFPLGELTKEEVRVIAREQGMASAQRPDSQDICFVPGGDYAAFIQDYRGTPMEPGNIVDPEGKVLGTHRGALGYTIGQRKGLGLSVPEPVYVCAKDMAAGTVTVAGEEALFSSALLADEVSWLTPQAPHDPMPVQARIRYGKGKSPATLTPLPDGRAELVFQAPQRAITPGQTVAFYDGDVVLGGGRICEILKD